MDHGADSDPGPGPGRADGAPARPHGGANPRPATAPPRRRAPLVGWFGLPPEPPSEHPDDRLRRPMRHVTRTRCQASSSAASRSDHSHHGAEGGTRIRQSALYSDRPRRSRPRRPARAEEQPNVVTSSELGVPITDPPTFEALSLSDPAPSASKTMDVGQSGPRPMAWPMSVYRTITVPTSYMDPPKYDSDDDDEEQLRLFREYSASLPKDFWEGIAYVKAKERVALDAIHDEWIRQTQMEVLQRSASAVAHPQPSMPQRASRFEASVEETVSNGKDWMNKEVMMCFKKYVERSPHLTGLVDYDLDELKHQCINVDSYNKVYHHYNFTVRMKMPISVDWTVQLYFGEVKEMFRRKYYVCSPLEPNENGRCYACKNQGVEELRHPAFGVFEVGSIDYPVDAWYSDDDE